VGERALQERPVGEDVADAPLKVCDRRGPGVHWTGWKNRLGRALVNYVLIMDPEMIIIGGGLADSGAALLDPLTSEVQGGLAWRSAPTITGGRFGADAGRRGAALLAWRMLNEQHRRGGPG